MAHVVFARLRAPAGQRPEARHVAAPAADAVPSPPDTVLANRSPNVVDAPPRRAASSAHRAIPRGTREPPLTTSEQPIAKQRTGQQRNGQQPGHARAPLARFWAYVTTRAWPLWTAYTLAVVLARLTADPTRGNVYNIYRVAGQQWLDGGPLYDQSGFYYLPGAALPFVPLAGLPFAVGGAIWRVVTLMVFVLGTWRLLRDCGATRSARRWFPLVSLVVAALTWSCARHGQMTLAMGGVMMLAVAWLQRQRWWPAALALAGAVALKPLAVVLLLIAPFLYPRVTWRLAVASVLFFALPFAFQSFDYVWSQYAAVPEMLRTASNREQTELFYHLPALLQSLGVPVGIPARFALRAGFAVATLALCVLVHRRVENRRQGFFLISFTMGYILLFGSGTERNTYSLMVPPLGLLLALAVERGERGLAWLLGAMAFATLTLSSLLSRAFPGTPIGMLKVWVCLLFLALVLREVRAARKRGP